MPRSLPGHGDTYPPRRPACCGNVQEHGKTAATCITVPTSPNGPLARPSTGPPDSSSSSPPPPSPDGLHPGHRKFGDRNQQYRSLQQFFRWLALEEGLSNPMAKLRPPKVTDKPVPFFTGTVSSTALSHFQW